MSKSQFIDSLREYARIERQGEVSSTRLIASLKQNCNNYKFRGSSQNDRNSIDFYDFEIYSAVKRYILASSTIGKDEDLTLIRVGAALKHAASFLRGQIVERKNRVIRKRRDSEKDEYGTVKYDLDEDFQALLNLIVKLEKIEDSNFSIQDYDLSNFIKSVEKYQKSYSKYLEYDEEGILDMFFTDISDATEKNAQKTTLAYQHLKAPRFCRV